MAEPNARRTRFPDRTFWELLVFSITPVILFATLSVVAVQRDVVAFDLEHFMLPAARIIADGGSPYPGYGYPPLVAFVLVPLTFIPGAGIVASIILIACIPASLWFLGVRDWRCYGVVFLWPPVLAAIQTANVTIPLLLGSAICWHYRDRWKLASVAGGLTIAAKLLTAPLLVWLAATRRFASAIGICVVAALASLPLWAVLGFSDAVDYPSTIGNISRITSQESYTLKVLLQDVGFSAGVAQVGWAALALAVLGGCAALGWRGDDRRSFALAVAAMIVAIPVVWLHSFALLVAAVAVMRPRLSAAWLIPILFVIGPGTGNGEPWVTAGVLAIMAVTLAVALTPQRGRSSGAMPAQPDHFEPSLR